MMQQLLEIFSHYVPLPAGPCTEKTDIRTDLGMDSLQLAAAAGEIEDSFGVEISDEALADMATVGDVLDFLGKA